MIGNLVEQDQRRRFFESEQLGQRADFQFPVRAVDFFNLAELARGVDKFPQVVDGHAGAFVSKILSPRRHEGREAHEKNS